MYRPALLAAALLCLSAPHMPAPITVPPEDQPTTNVTGQGTSAPRQGKAKSSAKPAPAKEKNLSLAGTWTGTSIEPKSFDGDFRKAQQSWTVSGDEKTVSGSWVTPAGSGSVSDIKCRRNGNTLTWIVITSVSTGPTIRIQSTLTIKNEHSANLRFEGTTTVGGTEVSSTVGTGTLKR